FHTADIVSQREKEERLRYALLEMRAALDKFFEDSYQNPAIPAGDKPRFPRNVAELLNTKRPIAGGSFYLRRLPLNPMFAAIRWQLIGNNGVGEELLEINDAATSFVDPTMSIVDVRCPDTVFPANGLNGIPYKDW
ncbi:MAG: hypothetical protein ACD_39C01223G0003, partial [uncultured bacterium]